MAMGRPYKKMLRAMAEKEKGKKRPGPNERWFLYILRCCDGTLYTGVTKDILRRFKMHCLGKASRYTRTRLPVTLIYQEHCRSRTQALIRECEVKTYSRARKLALAGV